MSDFANAAQRFDALIPLTDAQAGELRDLRRRTGQFPLLTNEAPGLAPELLSASVNVLRDVLNKNALSWDSRAEETPALAHFADGLLYAAAMLSSCQKLELKPADALAVFTTWAESFAHDVLSETGTDETQRQQVLDAAAQHPELFAQLLRQLPHDMARGALMAALSVYYAAVFSRTSLDAATVQAFFTHAAYDLTESQQ